MSEKELQIYLYGFYDEKIPAHSLKEAILLVARCYAAVERFDKLDEIKASIEKQRAEIQEKVINPSIERTVANN